MRQDEILEFAAGLPGVRVETADEASGAPEIAWGDSFIYYDPDGLPADQRWPFATIVIKDYTGFDEASQLDREGVFRLNINVGREVFRSLVGLAPAEFDDHRGEFDYTALDTLIPHPLYGQQAWVSILNPSSDSTSRVRYLLTGAHERAARRR